MFHIKKFLWSLLKWTVTLIAVGNLIFLFVFDYRLPGFLQNLIQPVMSASLETELCTDNPAVSESVTESEPSPESHETDTKSVLTLHVPETALVYDASGELYLLEGVTVTDASGELKTEIPVFSSIKPGDSAREKIIEYSLTTPDGERITAGRPLHLGSTYIGPMIELRGEIPTMKEEELPSLLSILMENQLLHADDGFGKEISTSVTASFPSDLSEMDEAIVTLSVTNLVNDSYSLDVTVPLRIDGPVLRLTTEQVTLQVGDTFSFYDYIAAAEDDDGTSLYHHIQMSGSVNTSVAGTYVLDFFCTDLAGNPSPVKTLTVIVK